MSQMKPHRARWAPALELFGIVACTLAFGAAAYRLASAIDSPTSLAIVVGSLPIGYLFADIVAGAMHWFCDSFFEEDTPLIGSTFIRPFREHHRDPMSITRHGFLELNGNNCLAVAPLCVALLWIDATLGAASLALFAAGFAFVGATAATNQFHRWAHEAEPSLVARFLQRNHLILAPRHHQVHHTPPFVGHYCVTSGWMNSALERVRFWRAAESVLMRLRVPKSRNA
jgi:hypothetical protein